MKLEYILRFENDERGNTWYSNNFAVDKEAVDFQVHTEPEVHSVLGKPRMVKVTIEPHYADSN